MNTVNIFIYIYIYIQMYIYVVLYFIDIVWKPCCYYIFTIESDSRSIRTFPFAYTHYRSLQKEIYFTFCFLVSVEK